MQHRKPDATTRGMDSSYGRLIRRLDQAMDVARTRNWLAGEVRPPQEVEVCGLSTQDAHLLRHILSIMELSRAAPSPQVLAACQQAQQQNGRY